MEVFSFFCPFKIQEMGVLVYLSNLINRITAILLNVERRFFWNEKWIKELQEQVKDSGSCASIW